MGVGLSQKTIIMWSNILARLRHNMYTAKHNIICDKYIQSYLSSSNE